MQMQMQAYMNGMTEIVICEINGGVKYAIVSVRACVRAFETGPCREEGPGHDVCYVYDCANLISGPL